MEQTYEVKIPNIMNPFTVEVNGKSYSFPAGTTQMVTQEVYDVIRNIESMVPTPNPRAGEPSFESLRDRPFGDDTEVLFDQRVEFQQNGDEFIGTAEFPEMIEAGKTYTVTYNGTVYECVGFDPNDEGVGYIGNLIVAGGEDTGEPFVMAAIDNGEKGNIELVVFPINGDTSATVKIEKSVIHTIDPKFLPGGGDARFVVDAVWDYETDPNTLTFSKTFDEIRDAINAGKEVVLREDGRYIYPLVGFYDEVEAVFTLLSPGNEITVSSYNYSLRSDGIWKYWDNSWSATVGSTITNEPAPK